MIALKHITKSLALAMGILVMVLVASVAQATVTAVGTDTTTGPNWRTAAALETDNEYGTDGYVIYGIDEADGVFANPYAFDKDQTVLPVGITAIATTAVQMWSGNSNFGTMQDPGNGNTIVNTPLAVLLGSTSSTFTISRAPGASFRLTLLAASGDNANVTYNNTVDDGSGGGGLQSSTHTANGLHYHVYDISSGSSDVVVTVSAGNHFSLTGLAFDAVVTPPPDTTPPSWVATWPQVDTETSDGATARAQIDEDGTAYYVVLTDGADAPSTAQVKAGTDASDAAALASGSIALSAATDGTIGAGFVVNLSGAAVDDVTITVSDAGYGGAGGNPAWAESPAGSLPDVPDSATDDFGAFQIESRER